MDKVVAKNERNSAKSETGHVEVEKSAKTENYIGWRTDILENNKVSGDILANREANGYNSVYKEKENITGLPISKEVRKLLLNQRYFRPPNSAFGNQIFAFAIT